MWDHLVVSGFSRAGYNLYGERMVNSLMRHAGLRAYVFSEDVLPKLDDWIRRPGAFAYRMLLEEEPGWRTFLDSCPPVSQPSSYWERWDLNGRRFSHKVFAVTSEKVPESRWRIWIDGDVEFHADMPESALAHLCPETACLSFLGRQNYAWSECGFVAYKVSDPRVKALLADMRRVYTSGELFTLPRDRWHDSAVFDLCRARSGIPESEQHNLSAGVAGREVWEHTLLQSFASHRKGPKRKLKHYGGVCE